MKISEIINNLEKNIRWAKKHRVFPGNIREQSSIFAEEALEVIQAINNFSEPEKHGSQQKIVSELFDSMTVIFRMLERL